MNVELLSMSEEDMVRLLVEMFQRTDVFSVCLDAIPAYGLTSIIRLATEFPGMPEYVVEDAKGMCAQIMTVFSRAVPELPSVWQLSEWDEAQAIKILSETLGNASPVMIDLSVREVWSVIMCCQVATRHPETPATLKQMIVDIGLILQNRLCDRLKIPELYAIIDTGWYPEFDVEVK